MPDIANPMNLDADSTDALGVRASAQQAEASTRRPWPAGWLRPSRFSIAGLTPFVEFLRSGLRRQAVEFLRLHAGLLAVLGIAVCLLSPGLESGFFGDDLPNSCTAGFMLFDNFNFPKFLGAHIKDWMINGRFFPGALAVTYVVHKIFVTALPYKCFLLALTLSNLVEFYYLLRCWKVHRSVAQLGTLSLVLLFQMRLFPDPLMSFAGVLQFVTGELLLSLICLQKYLDSRRALWLAGSAYLYFSSLVTYEITYFFLPIYLAMVYAHCGKWRQTLLTMRFHILTLTILSSYVIGLRYHVPAAGNPYVMNLDGATLATTMFRQTTAALPLSYALLSDHRQSHLPVAPLFARWDNLAILLACGALTLALLRKLPKVNRLTKGRLCASCSQLG